MSKKHFLRVAVASIMALSVVSVNAVVPFSQEIVVSAATNVSVSSLSELNTAINSSSSSNPVEVQLSSDIYGSISIASGKVVTINLNGRSIIGNDSKTVITNNGNLTINGTGDVTKSTNVDSYVINNNGTMTINGGNFHNTSTSSSLVRNNGTMFINDGTFSNSFIAIKNDDNATLTIKGGNFSTSQDGATALQNWSTASISGGTFTANQNSFAITVNTYDNTHTADLNITDGTINGNVHVSQFNTDGTSSNVPSMNLDGGTINGTLIVGDVQNDVFQTGKVTVNGATVNGDFGFPKNTTGDIPDIDVISGKFTKTPLHFINTKSLGISYVSGSSTEYIVGSNNDIVNFLKQETISSTDSIGVIKTSDDTEEILDLSDVEGVKDLTISNESDEKVTVIMPDIEMFIKGMETIDLNGGTATSSNSKVATVDANGKITAIAKGTATITVDNPSEKLIQTYDVTVSTDTLSVTPTSVSIEVGKTATVKPNLSNVTYKSNNTSIATVNDGVITGKKAGSTTITITDSLGQTVSVKVTVTNPKFTLTDTSVTIKKGATYTIKGSNQIKSCTSKDTKIATVTNAGVITGKSNGKTTITVTDIYGQTATFTVTVTNTTTGSNVNLTVGSTKTISLNGGKATSSNTKIATIDANGKITAIAKGTATITVVSADGTLTTTYKVTVTNPKFTLTSTSATIKSGSTYTIKGSNKIKSCTSKDTKVATVTNAGVITGKSNGKTTITVTDIYGQTATFTITVTKTVTASNINLAIGDTKTISLNGGKATSSNTKIATIDANGKISALAEGSSTITVVSADGTLTTTYKVIVTNPEFTLSKNSATIKVKGTYTIKGSNAIDSCKSSNKQVATVTYDGVITGVSNGTTTITVTDIYGQEATFTITVEKFVNGDSINLVVGNTQTIDLNGGKATSSNTKVATIDANGKITAIAKGTTTITVVSANGTLTTTYNVTVTNPTLKLNNTSATIDVNSTYTIKASNNIKSCTSKDTKIATVTNAGVITGVSNGKTTITVTDIYGQTATFNIIVKKSVNGADVNLVVGNTQTINLNGGKATSSNSKVVTIDSNGKITAIAKGTATITVVSADGTLTTTYDVTVTNPTLKLTSTSATIDVDNTCTIKSSNTIKSCTSKDTKVATVTDKGVVTGVSSGKTTITVTDIYGQTATFTITVKENTSKLAVELLQLKKQVLGIVAKDVSNYDFNGDKDVNILDIIALKNRILNS